MKTVLIVDDEPFAIQVLRQFLGAAGFRIVVAANGVEALAQVAEHDPDIIITDVQMPKLDGPALCQQVLAEHPRADRLFVVVTSRFDRKLREWVATLPKSRFVEKPVSPRALVQMLKEHCANELLEAS